MATGGESPTESPIRINRWRVASRSGACSTRSRPCSRASIRRVPPELVFDRGIGDLAVIRTGAQVLDEGVVLGSTEFTPDHLDTPLILVMGHQRCDRRTTLRSSSPEICWTT